MGRCQGMKCQPRGQWEMPTDLTQFFLHAETTLLGDGNDVGWGKRPSQHHTGAVFSGAGLPAQAGNGRGKSQVRMKPH